MIHKEIYKIISEATSIPVERITRESNFADDLGIGSLDNIEILMRIEDYLEYEFDEEIAMGWQTVGDMLDSNDAKKS